MQEISGFNGRYKVDEEGNVYSMVIKGVVQNSPVVKLKAADNQGYKRVVLRHKGCNKSHGKYVHRLVAEAYLPNPNNLPEVNHIDGDKSNNKVSNLEWCTRKQNIEHAWGAGLSTNEMNKGKGTTTYSGTCLSSGEVVNYVSKENLKNAGFDPSCVIRCCKGERKKHKGYTWTKIKSSEKTN